MLQYARRLAGLQRAHISRDGCMLRAACCRCCAQRWQHHARKILPLLVGFGFADALMSFCNSNTRSITLCITQASQAVPCHCCITAETVSPSAVSDGM